MLRMQPRQRIDFHEAWLAGGVAPQIDTPTVAAAEDSPGSQSDRFRDSHSIIARRIDQAVLDQLLAALLVDVRISVSLRASLQHDLESAQHNSLVTGPRDADRKLAAGQIALDEHRLLIGREQ